MIGAFIMRVKMGNEMRPKELTNLDFKEERERFRSSEGREFQR